MTAVRLLFFFPWVCGSRQTRGSSKDLQFTVASFHLGGDCPINAVNIDHDACRGGPREVDDAAEFTPQWTQVLLNY